MANVINPAQFAGLIAEPGKTAGKSAAGQGADFGSLLESAARSSLDTMKAGEKMSAEAIAGNADLNDVVGAVTSAELTLQMAVAIRDKLVDAVQQISTMPM